MATLVRLRPEIVYMEGNALVPAKAVRYKKDENGQVIEVVKPRTRLFENVLKAKMKNELEGTAIFPTKKEVFISITYGINSKIEYDSLDLDNRAKTILDALKEVVYYDDAQVKVLATDKLFLKNSKEDYYSFSVKILNSSNEKLLQRNLEKIRPKSV